MVRLLLFGVLAAGLLRAGLDSTSVSAHANLIRTTPADGEVVLTAPEVVFFLSEPVVVEQSMVQVTDSTGTKRDKGDFHHHGDATNPGITVSPDSPNGQYTVTWDVPSATDGHRTSGTFGFILRRGPVSTIDAAPSPQATDVELDESDGSGAILVLVAAIAALAVVGVGVVVLMRRRG